MPPKVLFFFPHNPCPPRSGAHKRCLETLSGLKDLGCVITLVSSTLSSETAWDASSIQTLKAHGVEDVLIYQPTRWDYRFIRAYKFFYHLFRQQIPLDSWIYTPPRMRRWFQTLLQTQTPDLIFMNYAFWDGLLNHRQLQSIPRISDTHDLFTLNHQMWQALQPYFQKLPLSSAEVDDAILEEKFFEQQQLTPKAEEFHIYDRYTHIIAISKRESEILQQHTHHPQVHWVPMTQTVTDLDNQYNGTVVFPTGPNLFNLQGYFYFVKKVLPQILTQVPDFTLQVTGSCCRDIQAEPGVLLSGFVPSLQPVYAQARFMICPVIGGTGQPVKIVEAMAHGVPVLALKCATQAFPIHHQFNGLMAENAEEFAHYAIQLWNNPAWCRQLGAEAKRTIQTEFSRDLLLEKLAPIVDLKQDHSDANVGEV
jgi:Glycosyl transferases group 1